MLNIESLNNINEYWWKCLIFSFETPSLQVPVYDDWAKEMEAAYNLINKGDWINAKHYLDRAAEISSDQGNSIAPFLGIISDHFTGNIVTTEDAKNHLKALSTIVDKHSTVPIYWYSLGIMQIRAKNFDDALSSLYRSVENNEEFGMGWAAIALVTGFGKCYEQSQSASQKALKLKKDVHSGLVHMCLFQADYYLKNAISDYYPFDLSVFEKTPLKEAIDCLNLLPEIHCGYISKKEEFSKAILLIYADNSYFYEHVIGQVLSAIESGQSELCIHIHVCNPDANVVSEIIKLDAISPDIAMKYTFEQIKLDGVHPPTIYYSCVRFCRLFEFLIDAELPIMMLDADMIIRQPLDSLFTNAKNNDILLCQFEHEPIWQNITAAIMVLNNTDKALEYIGAVSTYILKHLFSDNKKGRWFLDQISLSIGFDIYQDDFCFGFLPFSEYCDLEHRDETKVWAIGNDKALQHKYNSYKKYLSDKYM